MSAESGLCGVVIHFGDLDTTSRFVEETAAGNPGVELIVVNNGPDSDIVVTERMADAVHVLGEGINRGYSRAANLGIEHALSEGFADVVILPNDGVIPPGALTRLLETSTEHEATIAGPLVVYEGADLIWADGLSFDRRWGVARNRGKGRPVAEALGSRVVDYVTGHCILLRGCDRPWLRFDEDMFLYYEDLAICDRTRDHRESVVVAGDVRVSHVKPGQGGYRFRRTQQRHMARSGLVYWAKYARGWQRLTQLLGFLALTVYRFSRSHGLEGLQGGLSGLGSGVGAAIRILTGRPLPEPTP